MTARGITYKETATLVTETCYSCGALFAMHEDFMRARRKDHQGFYCPSGHCQSYTGETDAERLKRELAKKEAALAGWRESYASLSEQLTETKKSAAAIKGQLTKAKNRAAAGLCQECNRSFVNVARHMQTKHGAHNEGMVGKEQGGLPL